ASVCHVDASKGMVACAKRNVELNNVSGDRVRYIVDDCAKFVAREARRGNFYDGIIMDPPSYGRGPSGEMWKLEDSIFELVSQCRQVLSKTPLFFALNSYTAGLAPSVMQYIVASVLKDYSGEITSDELGLRVSENGFSLPCGSTTMFTGK
ncbi:MAG: SAM-dependent methyltransferase, partial [Oscillospiraceae bacterium]